MFLSIDNSVFLRVSSLMILFTFSVSLKYIDIIGKDKEEEEWCRNASVQYEWDGNVRTAMCIRIKIHSIYKYIK